MPLDLQRLSTSEKLAASAYVLSREDWAIPPPPAIGDLIDYGKADLSRAVEMVKGREPHRFANLFGAVGGTTGAVLGGAVGKLVSDRNAWIAVLTGAAVGLYSSAAVGYLLDRTVGPRPE